MAMDIALFVYESDSDSAEGSDSVASSRRNVVEEGGHEEVNVMKWDGGRGEIVFA